MALSVSDFEEGIKIKMRIIKNKNKLYALIPYSAISIEKSIL
jgi:hypothetical protein